MAEPKLGTSADGETPMHYSAGAVIRRDGKYLLLHRQKPPPGWAGIAGHVDEGETPEDAIDRESFEECGLRVVSRRLIYEGEVPGNYCRRGVNTHYWYLYECEGEGEVVGNKTEAKATGWFTPEEIADLPLEEVWRQWFQQLGVIPA